MFEPRVLTVKMMKEILDKDGEGFNFVFSKNGMSELVEALLCWLITLEGQVHEGSPAAEIWARLEVALVVEGSLKARLTL